MASSRFLISVPCVDFFVFKICFLRDMKQIKNNKFGKYFYSECGQFFDSGTLLATEF